MTWRHLQRLATHWHVVNTREVFPRSFITVVDTPSTQRTQLLLQSLRNSFYNYQLEGFPLTYYSFLGTMDMGSGQFEISCLGSRWDNMLFCISQMYFSRNIVFLFYLFTSFGVRLSWVVTCGSLLLLYILLLDLFGFSISYPDRWDPFIDGYESKFFSKFSRFPKVAFWPSSQA